MQALSNDGPSITSLLDNAGAFTNEAAANDQEFQSFANDLASATSLIASDSSDIGTILSSLKQVLSQVTAYINGNVGSIGTVLSNVNSFTSQVLSAAAAAEPGLRHGGLVLQNLNNAIVTGPDGSSVAPHPLRPVTRHEGVRPADLRQRADPDPRAGRTAGEELRAEPGLRGQRGAVADGPAARMRSRARTCRCRR